MNIDFALILALLVISTGLIALLDKFVLARRRQQLHDHLLEKGLRQEAEKALKQSLWVEYARSFFPVFLLVLLLRSFLFEPFRIPSGSLQPTLLIGDFVLVNKYQYGLRLPVLNTKIFQVNEPKRGDIVVFRWPRDPSVDYIKRIVGLPGDHIKYVNKTLTINGEKIDQKFDGYSTNYDKKGRHWTVERRIERINGAQHYIYIRPRRPAKNFEVVVPPGHYFAMGDNRDDSSDSRAWGFLPENMLIGRAFAVWMSWDSLTNSVRWYRIGKKIT